MAPNPATPIDLIEGKRLLREIAAKHCPSEVTIVDLQGDQILQDAVSGAKARDSDRKSTYRLTGAEIAGAAIMVVQLAHAIVEFTVAWRKAHAQPKPDESAQERSALLDSVLRRHGVPEQSVPDIVRDFGEAISRMGQAR